MDHHIMVESWCRTRRKSLRQFVDFEIRGRTIDAVYYAGSDVNIIQENLIILTLWKLAATKTSSVWPRPSPQNREMNQDRQNQLDHPEFDRIVIPWVLSQNPRKQSSKTYTPLYQVKDALHEHQMIQTKENCWPGLFIGVLFHSSSPVSPQSRSRAE